MGYNVCLASSLVSLNRPNTVKTLQAIFNQRFTNALFVSHFDPAFALFTETLRP